MGKIPQNVSFHNLVLPNHVIELRLVNTKGNIRTFEYQDFIKRPKSIYDMLAVNMLIKEILDYLGEWYPNAPEVTYQVKYLNIPQVDGDEDESGLYILIIINVAD